MKAGSCHPPSALFACSSKYGAPQEATAERLIWHRMGPFERITVTKSEDHHDFPLPHMDYIEHTID